VDLRGSLFCEVRELSVLPLCGFYAAAIARLLQLFEVEADARVSQCRASTAGQKGCVVSVTISARASDAVPA
jgi:hypothetical protein